MSSLPCTGVLVCVSWPQSDVHHQQGIKMSNTVKVTSQSLLPTMTGFDFMPTIQIELKFTVNALLLPFY